MTYSVKSLSLTLKLVRQTGVEGTCPRLDPRKDTIDREAKLNYSARYLDVGIGWNPPTPLYPEGEHDYILTSQGLVV